MDRGAVSWNLRKQALVSLSTTKSKYVTVTHAEMEVIWIRMFLGDILHPLTKLVVLYCDNQSAIAVAKNDQYHACTKHIDIWYHFIQESISREIIEIRYCPTENMVADIIMKALPVKTFEHLQMLLGVHLDWGECCCSLSKCIYSDAEEAKQESGASEISHRRPVHICIGTCQSLM